MELIFLRLKISKKKNWTIHNNELLYVDMDKWIQYMSIIMVKCISSQHQ